MYDIEANATHKDETKFGKQNEDKSKQSTKFYLINSFFGVVVCVHSVAIAVAAKCCHSF